ncbi:helix-turn-helix transcriptional regulator [Enterobacter sp. Colony194]|uniref:helix-turn-helix domain-containing protein n=1 Tax=Enterobacter sp. Colony194 TaxID=2866201 RepID=UPI001C6A2D35|nr:helix-turn-helix transcriptional regulator [Enterobacter sp. Colony194]
MRLSHSIISNDHFFKVGICALLSPELIDDNFILVDMDTVLAAKVKKLDTRGKQLVAFISNDIDYYVLQSVGNVLFIDRKCKVNEILSFLVANDMRYHYQIKFALSQREYQILDYMHKGYSAEEIAALMGLKIKTFYAHRRNMVLKLRVGNRISLYRNIARLESACSQQA